MIPQNWLNKLEEQKSKTYDEAYAEFDTWKQTEPNKGANAQTVNGVDGTQFWKDWKEVDEQKKSEKGWGPDTYYSNFIGPDAKKPVFSALPQAKKVIEYVKTTLKNGWKKLGGDDETMSVLTEISNIGLIKYQKLKNLAANEYSNTTLAKIKNEKKREQLQSLINNVNDNLKLCAELVKDVNNYWDGWDPYLNTWLEDVKEYQSKWESVLEEIKNGNTQEPEPTNAMPDLSAIMDIGDESAVKNVFAQSDSADNTYQSIEKPNNQQDVSVNTTHTRIYEYFASTIQLDEMSIPIIDNIDSDGVINPFSGQHLDASSNLNENPYDTRGNLSPDKINTIGFVYPLLRINDHYFSNNDVKYFSLETVGFIPTIEVILECTFNDMLKTNQIKDGDLCSVFINPGHGSIKSYRGDFQITNVKVPQLDQGIIAKSIKIKFTGELYIPTIYDATQTFAFAGSSRDAIIDVAQKLGLGFFFSDPENTQDSQMWYSMSDGEQKSINTSPTIEYIKNTVKHAYKNFESFYDCWIDPRYAISFINIAQMLGGSGLDEEIDLAIFNSAMTAGKIADGANSESSAKEKVAVATPQFKLLSNIGTGTAGLTPFYVTKYAEKNNNSITNKLGLANANYYSIKNTGIQKVEDNTIEMNLSIPVNADKLKHGFYIMAGPGRNLTYTSAENGSFVNQHKSVQGGQIAETQSDDDVEDIIASGNNMLASGNTNKFYETAEGHNTLCNAWLKKKTIQVTLNGCNMQIMRGEKIPMLLRDNFNPMINYAQANTESDLIYQKIMASASGWFIIQNIRWIYDRDNIQKGTQWRTELSLTRREWPIPGYVKNQGQQKDVEKTADELYIHNDIGSSSVKEATQDQELQQTDNNAKEEVMTTNGLNPYMVTIYNDIVAACSAGGKKVKLVSGRRWFADEDGNKVEAATVQDGNLWKFVNANGDIVWYSSKTSPHATGDAIDIINDEGTTFDEVAQYIVSDNKTLYDMITNGTYLGIETSKDDTGNTVKHYHIGKPDKSNSETYSAQKSWWEKVVGNFKQTISYNSQNIQVSQYLKYSNK